MIREDNFGGTNKLYLTLHETTVSIQRTAEWNGRQEAFTG